MRRGAPGHLFVAALGLTLAAPAAGHEPMPPHAAFAEATPPSRSFDSILDIADTLAGTGEGRIEIRIETDPSRPDARVLLVTASGYADDSVEGTQWRFLAMPDPADAGRWQVIEAGERWRCYRGRTPMVWQPRLCI